MATESELGCGDIVQTLRIEELVKNNGELTIKLQVAEAEVGQLTLAIDQLKDGNLLLTVKLEDANNEIGRLGMVVKHQLKDVESINRRGK